MPLTEFQNILARLLSQNRSEDSYLAGAAALHFEPQSIRFSQDLDYFHDSEERVSSAFEADRKLLLKNGYDVQFEMNQPGYIRCVVGKDSVKTKVEWAQDSAWRFMPTVQNPHIGYTLHPIDLAINKILALAGRDEPRDYLDVHYTHEKILPLGAQVWAACGKDPGFNPRSLLELLKRRGKYHAEDFERLNLNTQIDLQDLKHKWLAALDQAENFFKKAPPEQIGCLYYSLASKSFVEPKFMEPKGEVVPHFACLRGVLPQIKTE